MSMGKAMNASLSSCGQRCITEFLINRDAQGCILQEIGYDSFNVRMAEFAASNPLYLRKNMP